MKVYIKYQIWEEYRKTNKKYRVTIDKKEYKSVESLEEAIQLRDRILNEINNAKQERMF